MQSTPLHISLCEIIQLIWIRFKVGGSLLFSACFPAYSTLIISNKSPLFKDKLYFQKQEYNFVFKLHNSLSLSDLLNYRLPIKIFKLFFLSAFHIRDLLVSNLLTFLQGILFSCVTLLVFWNSQVVWRQRRYQGKQPRTMKLPLSNTVWQKLLYKLEFLTLTEYLLSIITILFDRNIFVVWL